MLQLAPVVVTVFVLAKNVQLKKKNCVIKTDKNVSKSLQLRFYTSFLTLELQSFTLVWSCMNELLPHQSGQN